MLDRTTIQNFADQLKASLGGNDYVIVSADQLKASLGGNDYVIVSLGARGPNIDMPEGNVLATVRMGDDEATAEAKYLGDAVLLARGIIIRKREAELKKRKEKRDGKD